MTVDQIRRWISGTIRPGKVETDSVETEELSHSVDQEIPRDVTSSRSNNTWETNTTGRYLLVNVHTDAANTAAVTRGLKLHINSAQTNRTVTRLRVQNDDTNPDFIRASVTGIVPPGADYKIELIQGGIGTPGWFETEIGRPA